MLMNINSDNILTDMQSLCPYIFNQPTYKNNDCIYKNPIYTDPYYTTRFGQIEYDLSKYIYKWRFIQQYNQKLSDNISYSAIPNIFIMITSHATDNKNDNSFQRRNTLRDMLKNSIYYNTEKLNYHFFTILIDNSADVEENDDLSIYYLPSPSEIDQANLKNNRNYYLNYQAIKYINQLDYKIDFIIKIHDDSYLCLDQLINELSLRPKTYYFQGIYKDYENDDTTTNDQEEDILQYIPDLYDHFMVFTYDLSVHFLSKLTEKSLYQNFIPSYTFSNMINILISELVAFDRIVIYNDQINTDLDDINFCINHRVFLNSAEKVVERGSSFQQDYFTFRANELHHIKDIYTINDVYRKINIPEVYQKLFQKIPINKLYTLQCAEYQFKMVECEKFSTKLSFIHIPKTAGTSFYQQYLDKVHFLYPSPGGDELSLSHYKHRNSKLNADKAYYNPYKIATFFREPIHHVYSLYLECKYDAWGIDTRSDTFPTNEHEDHQSGFTPAFDLWLEHFNTNVTTIDNFNCYHPHNLQMRYIASNNTIGLRSEEMYNYLIDEEMNIKFDSETKRRVKEDLSFFGLTEYYLTSICLFEYKSFGRFLNCGCDCSKPHNCTKYEKHESHNVPPHPIDALSDKTISLIENLVDQDLKLYQYATSLFKQRVHQFTQQTNIKLCGFTYAE